MFNSLLEALGWPGLVLAALVALYLITRVPWWGARVCVPNAEAVEAVQREAPGWRRYGWSWIISFPPLDVISFFAALLWPVMVALNLLLLAQVLERFFPGGSRVDVGPFGSYTYLSLVVGSLYSISQTMFGIAAERAGKERKGLASLFMILLLLTIIGEMSLAGYRAREIEKGALEVGATLADQTFSQGVILTMFLSFIVPVAHSVLGFVALPRFIGPLIGYIPRFVGGLLIVLWSYFAEFFFGFQKVSVLPVAPSALLAEADTALASSKGLAHEAKNNIETAEKIPEIEKRWEEFKADEAALTAEVKGAPGQWQRQADSILAELKAASDPSQYSAINQKVHELQTQVERSPQLKVQRAGALSARAGRLADDAGAWTVKLADLKARVPMLQKSFADLGKKVESVEAEADKLTRILSPQQGQVKEQALNPGHAHLELILTQAMDFSNRGVQRNAAHVHAACMAAVARVRNEIDETRANLAPVAGQIALLEARVNALERTPPVVPTGADLKKHRDQLRQFQMEAMNSTTAFIVVIRGLNKQFAERTRGMKHVAAGPKKRFWLVRFFLWFPQKWSDFIDLVVGKPEPKPGEKEQAAASPETKLALLPAPDAARLTEEVKQ